MLNYGEQQGSVTRPAAEAWSMEYVGARLRLGGDLCI